jgi:hypothetical protein
MVKGTAAKVARVLAPLVYRECPMGNAHARWENQCECCSGNEFTYIQGRWVPTKYAPIADPGRHSSISWSGQLTGGELWLGALKQGLVLGLIVLLVGGWFALQAKAAAESAAQGMRRGQAAQQE